MPTVSIVVPCFNQERFIAECLESVLSQTYPDWECIVVDDGSTDGSGDVIEAFVKRDARFTYVRKENGGVASARNTGFAKAIGEYFLPLDGDDKLHPHYLSSVMDCFVRYPETTLVHCRTKLFGAKNKLWRLPSYSYERLLWRNMLVNSSVFRRAAFERSGGYSEEMVHGFEDWEFFIRLLDRDSVVKEVKRPLFYYRVSEKSRTNEQIQSGKIEQSMRLIYARNVPIYESHFANPLQTFSRMLDEFAPTYTGRYKRQLAIVHSSYIAALALLGAALLFR
ncbi:glycosyltransferase [Cupriavidus gilardii]|uniref:Glycosyltransferase n=1 Tax=Cupriavidus gilardii TaxID=82541 RepID=A0ABY4VLX1_9BURK|nr:glycosyltransferase [Cupriavidus gilardii]MCT9015070.1 glycosyltransferase [Cupriavidus gilardii]MCT9054840.1 glycosyltransferase [Cupriavidus gilardii]USE78050.1 glycosyltransferase [Cupriavidus gilardii]